MTNFDFLKNFNGELYEIGIKLEEDVISSPRAVTADATLFLENLVKDLYKISNIKLENHLKSFYKKIDKLYRLGIISYIYKNKLQEAYNLRNKIHNKNLNSAEEKKLALDLHKRLYYISKKYIKDNFENEKYLDIPDYKKPTHIEIHFDNCIICGNSNKKSMSNMCRSCNQKIENANLMLSLMDTFNHQAFTRYDLVEFGIPESRAILLLMDLSKYGAVINKGDYYQLKPDNFNEYLSEINKYVEIGELITKFYKDEISSGQIKDTPEYKRGFENEYPYREFFRLVNQKLEKTFEENLLKTKDISKSMKLSSMNWFNIKNWYYHEKDAFNKGSLNEAFILYNEILINEYFALKKTQLEENEILKKLRISNDIFYFWQNQFIGGKFFKKSKIVKQEIILKEIKNHKTLSDALRLAKISKNDFEKMYLISKESNDNFYQNFEKEYTRKRQKLLIKHLRNHNLNKAIKLSKITKKEFLKWYYHGEKSFSNFYVKTTEILMDKYISLRKNNWDKKDILRHINVSKDMFQSWSAHDEFRMFRDFEDKNNQITSSLIKRGKIINAIKKGKGKEEAIFSANLTPREFVEIYNTSKKEKTEFYLRFDVEYEKNRKKLFMQMIPDEDFYCTIQKCEIPQKEFNKWYVKDQENYISTNKSTAFYMTATYELMDKYLQARRDGKNKPDAAKSAGLSNIIINKWLNNPDHEIFKYFINRNNQLNIDLIEEGFENDKSKREVSEIYDISIKTIEEYIEMGKNGDEEYQRIFDLYENSVVPYHLEEFIRNFENKTFLKSLKLSKLSKQDLDYYYNLGKEDDGKFSEFHDKLLEIKIVKYIESILSNKSPKIAMKNSNLTEDEFIENREFIEEMILKERIYIIADKITKHKFSGVKIAKYAGITVNQLYEWYMKGKNGEEKYELLSMLFEVGFIIPRVMSYKKAENAGIPTKWLNKQLKKNLGITDYKLWLKHDILNQKMDYMDDSGDYIDEEKIKKVIEDSDFFDINIKEGEDEDGENEKDGKTNPMITISVIDNPKSLSKPAIGK